MSVKKLFGSIANVSNLEAVNVVHLKQTYNVTVVVGTGSHPQLWQVALVRDDRTYVLNPSAGQYSDIVEIHVRGAAGVADGVYTDYYLLEEGTTTLVDGHVNQSIQSYDHSANGDLTLSFLRAEPPSYTVTISNSGSSTPFQSFPSYWTTTLTKLDGTTITPNTWGSHSGVVSIQVTGTAYVHLSEGDAAWYTVTGVGGTQYFNGQSSPSTTTFNLQLEKDTTVSYVNYVNEQGCFAASTLVKMADGTDKPIDQVQPGDLIKAYNCRLKSDDEDIVDVPVEYSSYGYVRKADKYDRYTFSNGTTIDIIDRDRVYNIEDNKMKWMDEWRIGEHALTYDGEEVALVSHEVINEEVEFSDFVCQYHNYFLNGLLAGQKMARYPFFESRRTSNN